MSRSRRLALIRRSLEETHESLDVDLFSFVILDHFPFFLDSLSAIEFSQVLVVIVILACTYEYDILHTGIYIYILKCKRFPTVYTSRIHVFSCACNGCQLRETVRDAKDDRRTNREVSPTILQLHP